jgi:hypothetical protein
VLVGPDRGAVEEVLAPIHVAPGVGLGLQRCQDVVPDARLLPAAEPRVHRRPRPVPLRQIAPGDTRGQPPENAIEDRAMGVGGASGGWSLRREQRLQPFPLPIAQFVPSYHAPTVLPLCKHALEMYQEAGVPLIWLIDPDNETVTIIAAGQPTRVVKPGDTLDGGDVLPGFTVPVAEIFA